MAGRRGARSGRGWDALPPRAARRQTDEHPSGGPPDDGAERGNVPARRRWGPPGGPPDGSAGGSREPGAGQARPPQSESELAREICLRQLAVRPRTRAELAKALHRKGISDEVIAEVLDRYDEVGIIDDAAFAR